MEAKRNGHVGVYVYSKGKIMIHLTLDYKSDQDCRTPGEYLRYHRTFQGKSTREVAESVGIVPATLVLYENDKHPIKYNTAVSLAEELNIDLNACPGVREKKCTFKAVEGVSLDEFVVQELSRLNDEQNDLYRKIFESRIANMIRTEQSEQEYQETKKAVERLNTDIAAQVRNLREADEALRRFIQDDIKELTEELAKREADLRRMEDLQTENQYMLHELGGIKKRLLSFEEYAKDAQPETVFTLIHTLIERIYITNENNELKCQIYIKGCATEDYTNLFGAADYIDNNTVVTAVTFLPPMCDLDYYSICAEV